MTAPRVAIITSNYWPERTGIGQVTTEFAEFLSTQGIDVRVATAMPYYPEWSVYQDYRKATWLTERHSKVVIHRAAHYASPNPGAFGRILHEVSLCLLSFPNMIRALWRSDAAFVVSPDLSHAFVGCLTARGMGVRLTLVIQDVMPDAAVEMGMLTSVPAIAIARWIARTNYRLAHTIHTLSDGMKTRIARSTGTERKVRVVPNTIDGNELAVGPNQGNLFRERFVPAGTVSVVHTGNMGEKQDLYVLLRAARRLLDKPNIHFYVFGDGAVKADFLRLREQWKLSNVSHFPLQDRSLLPHILYGADVCLITQLPAVIDVVVPSKLITSMGAGAMIVAACSLQSEAAALLRASGGGVIVPAGDDLSLSSVILRVSEGSIDVAAARRLVRQFAMDHFNREAVYGPIAKRLIDAKTKSGASELETLE